MCWRRFKVSGIWRRTEWHCAAAAAEGSLSVTSRNYLRVETTRHLKRFGFCCQRRYRLNCCFHPPGRRVLKICGCSDFLPGYRWATFDHWRPEYYSLQTYQKPQCFFRVFFTAVIYIYIYIHIIHFHLLLSVNIYWNWLEEQFCNLSLYILYIQGYS